MYFDSHAHYDDKAFNKDREELLTTLPDRGVSLVLNPGCDRSSSESAIAISERFSYIYAAVGWHPHDAKNFESEGGEEFILSRTAHERVMAVGEIGLDYHYDHSPRDVQREVFTRQMELARELNMPVIVHDREAHADVLETLRRFPELRGVMHCYSGSAEFAREILALGWHISFTGAVTFKNARQAIEALERIPLDRLMIETDAPYMSPEPYRGKRCDSGYLEFVVRRIAEVKGESEERIAEITMANAREFFGI